MHLRKIIQCWCREWMREVEELRLKQECSCKYPDECFQGPGVRLCLHSQPESISVMIGMIPWKESLGGKDVSSGLGSSQKRPSDCAIAHRLVCVSRMRKDGEVAKETAGSAGFARQQWEGHVRGRATDLGSWCLEDKNKHDFVKDTSGYSSFLGQDRSPRGDQGRKRLPLGLVA